MWTWGGGPTPPVTLADTQTNSVIRSGGLTWLPCGFLCRRLCPCPGVHWPWALPVDCLSISYWAGIFLLSRYNRWLRYCIYHLLAVGRHINGFLKNVYRIKCVSFMIDASQILCSVVPLPSSQLFYFLFAHWGHLSTQELWLWEWLDCIISYVMSNRPKPPTQSTASPYCQVQPPLKWRAVWVFLCSDDFIPF